MHILLASASPRRRELIHRIGWEADIEKSDFPEVKNEEEALSFIRKEKKEMEFAPFAHSSLVCAANAFGKAADAASRRGDGIPVVGADTIVVLGQDILGKPENQEDAFCMLRALSGKPTQSKPAWQSSIREKQTSPSHPQKSDSGSLKTKKSENT